MALKMNRRYRIYWGPVSKNVYDVVRLQKTATGNAYFKFLYSSSPSNGSFWHYDEQTKIGMFSDNIETDLGERLELLD